MKKEYYIQWRGYECCGRVTYSTKREAQKELREAIQDDINSSRYHLGKIKHSPNHYETKIGGRNGYNTFSEGWIVQL